MSHRVMLFCGALPALAALRGEAEDCRIFQLSPEAPFPVLPVTGAAEDPNLPESRWYGPVGRGEERSLVVGDVQVVADASRFGPIAYVETDYFGSAGSQSAALWRDGALVMALATEWAGGAGHPDGAPINRALRGLGVAPDGGDEFSVIGLGGYRSNDDIVTDAVEVVYPSRSPTDLK